MTTHNDRPHATNCRACLFPISGGGFTEAPCNCAEGTRWHGNGARIEDAIAIQGIATFFARLQPDLSAQLSEARRALASAKTVIDSKDKAYALIQQRWDAMAAKAATTDSERECNEKLTYEIDDLRRQLSEAQARLAEIEAKKPKEIVSHKLHCAKARWSGYQCDCGLDGMVRVPVTLTEAMFDAADNVYASPHAMWRAMLSAAQDVSPAAQSDTGELKLHEIGG